MPTATEIADTVQSGILKAIETSQQLTLDALRAATSTIDGILPAKFGVPFAPSAQRRQEAIDAGFGFAEKILNSQKAFLSELVTVTTPAK